MQNKKASPVEILWLIVAILCFIIAIHKTYRMGFSHSYVLFILGVVSLLMYGLRRYLRKS